MKTFNIYSVKKKDPYKGIIEGYKLKEKYIPDPVVLKPVKGGYLILTVWVMRLLILY